MRFIGHHVSPSYQLYCHMHKAAMYCTVYGIKSMRVLATIPSMLCADQITGLQIDASVIKETQQGDGGYLDQASMATAPCPYKSRIMIMEDIFFPCRTC